MSSVNTIPKQPFKLIKIPLSKFQDEVIPHHQALYESHKNILNKLIITQNVQQIHREIRKKEQVIKQLKDLMYQLDTLRTQVEDSDLGTFDSLTVSIRKTILELVRNYSSLEEKATKQIEEYEMDSTATETTNNHQHKQIHVYDNLIELKIQERKDVLNRVEALNKDIEDVHEIFSDMNEMVLQQKEYVDNTETNVEVASDNIRGGLSHLVTASKLKKASYPAAGAFIGTLIGGPIGSVAGLKIGGLAAISCGLLGYVSGRFIKKTGDIDISMNSNSESVIENSENLTSNDSVINEKKDI